ncbi:unnamed protein product [Microthlaspi erraticum]|uniref:CCHC-type domain-containing protein n=1 Tax=Microthlaspi erraticum TaxID=1685480 RepID=A0A6D2I5B4_9BRAS|nr:unnamed protein product [Microthlaspi erraticum]
MLDLVVSAQGSLRRIRCQVLVKSTLRLSVKNSVCLPLVSEQQHEALGFSTRREEAPSSVRRDQNQSPDSRLELSSSSIRNRSALCSHCGRTGHEKKDCWQIVGFPDWWNERNTNSSGCGGRGGRGGRGAGINNGGRGCGQANAAHATSSNASSFPEFTPDQWKALSKLIQDKTGESNSDKLSGKKG